MTVFFGLVGSSGIIGRDGVDFTLLSPLPLAIALFVAIPVAYGAVMPWLTERLLLEGSAMRRRPWAWIVGLSPLVLANIVGVLVLLIALVVLVVRRRSPSTVATWRSTGGTWIGRALLVAAAVAGGINLLGDSLEIFS
jgi:hypothetical protein